MAHSIQRALNELAWAPGEDVSVDIMPVYRAKQPRTKPPETAARAE
ncbi:hypothetical protein ACL2XP_16180 [Sodalis sp. RH21]